MSFIYHYHATVNTSPGIFANIEVVLTSDKPIDSMDRYREVKKAIAGDNFDSEQLVINSLAFLHMGPNV